MRQCMMDKIKDMLGDFGSNTGRYASQLRCRTSALARDIGPKRGGIALGVLAGMIALPFIVRAIKNRRMERMGEDEEMIIVEEEQLLEPGVSRRPAGRRQRRRGGARRAQVY